MTSTGDAIAAETPQERLDPRWIRYRRQTGVLGALMATAALVTPGAVLMDMEPVTFGTIGTAILGVLLAVAWAWPAVEYRHASYALGGRALEVRRGVLWRSVIDVPRSRMQHSDVSQGPLERMHGLATLSVFTAGTRYALVRLHGLSHERAIEIREHLTRLHDDDVI